MRAHPDARKWSNDDWAALCKSVGQPSQAVNGRAKAKVYVGPELREVTLNGVKKKVWCNRWAYRMPGDLVVVTCYGWFSHGLKPNKSTFSRSQVDRFGMNPNWDRYPWKEGTDRRRF